MNYIEYRFSVKPVQPGSEILVTFLGEMGFETFENTDDGFIAYIQEKDAGNVNLDALSFDDFTYTYSTQKLPQQNWNAEWERNFEPVKVQDLLYIRAPFHEPDSSCRHEIVIMPKMSFGTGHHQTTRLVCKTMFSLDIKNKKVLDMGCGTAILAILAAKLGASDITGIDIDQWCVENSIENCAANGTPQVKVLLGGAELLAEFSGVDILLANINRNILKAQVSEYARVTKKGGTLIMSGFFTTDADELKKAAGACGFHFENSDHENEWCMLRFRRS
jgi:ribosomal protein L11 methyltransferase